MHKDIASKNLEFGRCGCLVHGLFNSKRHTIYVYGYTYPIWHWQDVLHGGGGGGGGIVSSMYSV